MHTDDEMLRAVHHLLILFQRELRTSPSSSTPFRTEREHDFRAGIVALISTLDLDPGTTKMLHNAALHISIPEGDAL